VRTVIMGERPEPVTNINFTINVGVAVPQVVVLRTCPARVIDLVTGLRVPGCRYFLLPDGRIVIVRADTRAIVLIITA
jgi:hypothetical protein